jgi:hypothetical protein
VWGENKEDASREICRIMALSEMQTLSRRVCLMPQKKMTKSEYESYLAKRNAKNKKDPNVLFGSSSAWLKKNL